MDGARIDTLTSVGWWSLTPNFVAIYVADRRMAPPAQLGRGEVPVMGWPRWWTDNQPQRLEASSFMQSHSSLISSGKDRQPANHTIRAIERTYRDSFVVPRVTVRHLLPGEVCRSPFVIAWLPLLRHKHSNSEPPHEHTCTDIPSISAEAVGADPHG